MRCGEGVESVKKILAEMKLRQKMFKSKWSK